MDTVIIDRTLSAPGNQVIHTSSQLSSSLSIRPVCFWSQSKMLAAADCLDEGSPGQGSLSPMQDRVCAFDRRVNIAGLLINPLWEASPCNNISSTLFACLSQIILRLYGEGFIQRQENVRQVEGSEKRIQSLKSLASAVNVLIQASVSSINSVEFNNSTQSGQINHNEVQTENKSKISYGKNTLSLHVKRFHMKKHVKQVVRNCAPSLNDFNSECCQSR